MNFLSNFILLLKARYPIIYIVTSEEERVEYFLKYMVKKHLPRAYYSWDFIEGFKGNPNDKGFATRNPLEALEFVDKLTPETAAIFVLKDYDNFLNDLSVTRKLKNLGRTLKLQPKNLVIVSPELNIPDTLKEFVTVIELPLPTYSEISSELKRLMSSLEQQISEKTIASLSTACQGLSLERVRRVLSKIIVQYGEINELSPALVLEEKKQLVQQTQVLEFCLTNKKISDLGGLENLKSWLKIREEAFSQDAITYGLPYPKGVLLVGAQGTGKSITAEIIANEWKLPLLRLDFGRLFASLVGQSESRVRSMIQTAEALSPCVLYIDEIDKAFGGRQSSGDNGTSNRVLATFLTWLGEKVSPHSYRILKKDCLDLPEKSFVKREVELSDEQKQAYAEMKVNATTMLKGQSATALNVLTQLIRLHQITCGHMKTDDGEIINLKNSRLNELMQILGETTGKVIIWANYVHDILNIERAIKDEYGSTSYCTYYGATKSEDRQKCIKKFQEPSNPVRFFIGNTQTGGYGITLTEASTVIYYSNNYDLEKRIQSEDRAHRIGQKNPVLYIDLVAKGTVDEKIIQSLRNKINIAREISGEELVTWI